MNKSFVHESALIGHRARIATRNRVSAVEAVSRNPRVSICIPAYNQARFLPDAIESVLAQTYDNIEVIIVDDGSTDGTLQIATGYAARHPEVITVFTHPEHRNLGISTTVNRGLRESSGEYCSLLGSDDIFYPHKTEQQLRYLQRHPDVGAVYSTAQFMDADGNEMLQRLGQNISGDPGAVEALIRANRIPDMTVLFRRASLKQVGPHDENLVYGDWEFWIRLAAQIKIAFINKPLVRYRVHNSNVSMGVSDEVNFHRALQVMESLLRNQCDVELLNTPRIRALIYFQRARYLFCTGQTERAADSLAAGFQIYPVIEDEPSVFVRWMTDVYLPYANAQELYPWLSAHLPAEFGSRFRIKVTKSFKATAAARASRQSYQAGDIVTARQMALKAQSADLRLLADRELLAILTKTMFGSKVLNRAKRLKRRIRGTQKFSCFGFLLQW